MLLCNFKVGQDHPFFLIAGPCVIESEELSIEVAGQLKELTSELQIPFIYKSSFDKANRSSHDSYRGPGVEKGLKIHQTAPALGTNNSCLNSFLKIDHNP